MSVYGPVPTVTTRAFLPRLATAADSVTSTTTTIALDPQTEQSYWTRVGDTATVHIHLIGAALPAAAPSTRIYGNFPPLRITPSSALAAQHGVIVPMQYYVAPTLPVGSSAAARIETGFIELGSVLNGAFTPLAANLIGTVGYEFAIDATYAAQ
ncbi:hypothetical protein PMV_246 [Port-miou virus]|uniref:Uncharacterized protein n=1 Tax=Port-miou virus TaxID=1733873 RepID=A0A0N7G2F0_9VIRU|nr:hypothetical protein PMV_246 [Port-miou virus]